MDMEGVAHHVHYIYVISYYMPVGDAADHYYAVW